MSIHRRKIGGEPTVLRTILVVLAMVMSGTAWGQSSDDTEQVPGAQDTSDLGATSETDSGDPAIYQVSQTSSVSPGPTARPGEARGWDEMPSTPPEDYVLFVPRVVFGVVKYAFIVVLLPVQGLLYLIAATDMVDYVERVLYFNDDHTFGWLPFVLFFTSDGFTGGATIFHNDVLGYDESVTASARFGGRYSQSYELAFAADRFAGSRVWFETLARYEVNPSLPFSGIGTTESPGCNGPDFDPRLSGCTAYFNQERILAALRVGYTYGSIGNQLQLGVSGVFNNREFGPQLRDNVSIEAVYDTSLIPGFDEGYNTFELNAHLVVDTREHRGLSAVGWFFEVFGGSSLPIDDFEFFQFGSELSLTLDLFHSNRLLAFRAATHAVFGEEGDVPFTDLPRLGGANRLRGYFEDQFRDEVAGFAGVEYHYPIHQSLHGVLFLDVGQVAQDYGDLFSDLGDWQLGGGGGFLLGNADDISFRLDIAGGDGLKLFVSTDLARAFEDRSRQL